MRVEQLAELELAYPTFISIIGLTARQLMHDLESRPAGAQKGMLGMHGAEWEHGDVHASISDSGARLN